MNRPVGQSSGARPAEPDRLVIDAVWRGDVRPASDAALQSALPCARRNQVEGRLARAYPRQLAGTLVEVRNANESFRQNLSQVAARLLAAGISAVLIEADPAGDCVYGDFNLVVRERDWKSARAVLADWYVRASRYWLERSTKILLEPPSGPTAHLHNSVSWFGVPVIPNDTLFGRAVQDGSNPWLVPGPAEQLRVWLAHGLFQNLSLDLSELLAVRDLMRPDVTAEAQHQAIDEGWGAAFGRALAMVADAMARLDSGLSVRLPFPLPSSLSLKLGAEHVRHLMLQRRARSGAREAALRLPLVVAKKRKMLAL
jgi:hypothetical protein